MAERPWRSKWTISSEKGVVTNRGISLAKQVASSLLIGRTNKSKMADFTTLPRPTMAVCWSGENYSLEIGTRRAAISDFSFSYCFIVYYVVM